MQKKTLRLPTFSKYASVTTPEKRVLASFYKLTLSLVAASRMDTFKVAELIWMSGLALKTACNGVTDCFRSRVKFGSQSFVNRKAKIFSRLVV